MNQVYQISFPSLAWISIPVIVLIYIYIRWSQDVRAVINGLIRMFLQLILIGYALNFIFKTNSPSIILLVLSTMLVAASLIALRPLVKKRRTLYLKAFLSIFAGSVITLFIVTQGVLAITPWFAPNYIIPIAGMIFANSMNALSLGAERFEVEHEREKDYYKARSTAFKAALIPITNSLFAVGLVSIPGMMTGQILSGISPVIAARYQIMVMCMILSSAGISSALYLWLLKNETDVNP